MNEGMLNDCFDWKKAIKVRPLLEMPGFEPGAFHMQSERATTALHPRTLPQPPSGGTNPPVKAGMKNPSESLHLYESEP